MPLLAFVRSIFAFPSTEEKKEAQKLFFEGQRGLLIKQEMLPISFSFVLLCTFRLVRYGYQSFLAKRKRHFCSEAIITPRGSKMFPLMTSISFLLVVKATSPPFLFTGGKICCFPCFVVLVVALNLQQVQHPKPYVCSLGNCRDTVR